LKILDAGCGTGNYAKAFIEMGAKQITLLDASSKMLDKARSKLKECIEKGMIAGIIEAKMPPMPFPDDTFDAVMFNVVSDIK
jgi:ubiquinone/menaquinone biosynthesis C-methylase UbiE